MSLAGLKTRVFFRAGSWGLAVLAAATITACGGGGGGGSSVNSGVVPPTPTGTPTIVITPTPSPSPTPSPTPTPAPLATIVAVPASGTTATVPAVAGYSGTVAFAAPSTGVANVTMTSSSGPSGGAPTLSSALRRPMALSGAPGLFYVALVSDGTLTFTGYPSFTFALPSTLTLTPNQPFYLALYASDQPTLGYAGPVAASAVTNVNGKNTVTFTSAFNAGFTIAKGVTYEFVVFTIATSLATPTPSASPSPTPTPTATPTATPTPTAMPTATATPTPTATPTGTPGATAAAPIVGYLAANPTASNSFLGKLSSAFNSTIVGIGTTFQNTKGSGSNLGSASINETVSAVGAQNFRRAVRGVPSNPFWLTSAWSQNPHSVDRFVEDPIATGRLTSSLHRAGARNTQSLRTTKGLPTTAGSTAGIWVENSSINGSAGTFQQVPATLQLVTAHGYIWLDNTITTFSPTQIAQIGADFENAYTSDVAHYGSPSYGAQAAGNQQTYTTCDAAGANLPATSSRYIQPSDNLIHVVVLNSASLGNGVGGYFYSLNHAPQAIANCFTPYGTYKSNESPMIFLGYSPNSSTSYTLKEDLVRGTAHELQHLINFVHHSVLQASPSDAYSPGPSELSWVNEGMSMLAQDFALKLLYPSYTNDVDDALYHAQLYLSAPQNFSITAFTGKDSSSVQYNCSGCYGAEYVFQRYLYDRFGGDAYLNTSLNHTIIGQVGVESATSQTLPTLLGDFGIALAASNLSLTTDPRFNFTNFNPRGTYTSQFQTVTLSGPLTAGALSPSTNAAVSPAPYLGTVFFLNASAAASANVSLTDTGGNFGLAVGVVQR